MKILMKPERVCALTDGVYAVVLTLMVLDLKIPYLKGMSNNLLKQDLVEQIPNFKAYVTSFIILARFWLKHHAIFRVLKACDGRVIFLNFVHIFFLALIPFTASLVGEYKHDEIGIVLLLSNLALCGLALSILKQYVSEKKDWQYSEVVEAWLFEPWYTRYAFFALAVVSILISYWNHDVALILCAMSPYISAFLTNKATATRRL